MEMLSAMPKEQPVQMEPRDAFVIMHMDLAVHMLRGQANQLGVALGLHEAAAELSKAAEHLEAFRQRHMAKTHQRVVLASPAQLPPPPPQAG